MTVRPCRGPSHAGEDPPITAEPLCPLCRFRVERALADLPAMYLALVQMLQPGPGSTVKVDGTPSPPMPLRAQLDQVLRRVEEVVLTWAELVRTTARLAAPGPVDLAARMVVSRPPQRRRAVAIRRHRVDLPEHGVRAGDPDRGPSGYDNPQVLDEHGRPVASVTVDHAPLARPVDRPDDSTAAAAVLLDCRALRAHLDTLLALPPTPVGRRVTVVELAALPDDTLGRTMMDGAGWVILDLDGAAAGCELLDLAGQIRWALGWATGADRLGGTCAEPDCRLRTLRRRHGSDAIHCAACGRMYTQAEYEWLVADEVRDLDPPKRSRRHLMQHGDRVSVRVLLVAGDQAELVTPEHDRYAPLRVPAADIAADVEMPANELPGRQLTARVIRGPSGGAVQLHDFALVDDPRHG